MATSPQGAVTSERQGVAMIKRTVRFATLMTAVALPAWLGVQSVGTPQAHAAGDAGGLIVSAAHNPQAAALNVIASQSFWHLMALSSR
jgi:hypothetical protein